jgi:hypothetical protein
MQLRFLYCIIDTLQTQMSVQLRNRYIPTFRVGCRKLLWNKLSGSYNRLIESINNPPHEGNIAYDTSILQDDATGELIIRSFEEFYGVE